MNILFIEPFYSGSHKEWLDGWVSHSEHQFLLYTLPARHWKWRMEAAAIYFAERFIQENPEVDLIFCSDFLNLGLFLSLAKVKAEIPTAVYFHENQLTYPWSDEDPDRENKRDRHYGFINYTTALVSDQVFFNSQYHLDSFVDTLPAFLKVFPDKQGLHNVARIKDKSSVLPLGFSFESIEVGPKVVKDAKPIILWNHRWEYDKNPQSFFNRLANLKARGVAFKLIICGEKKKKYPKIFDHARSSFEEEIIHFGYAKSKSEYIDLLRKSDILLITSNQDFFGISMVEAMYCGVYPIAPNRLAYPEHFFEENQSIYLYNSNEECDAKLLWACENVTFIRNEKAYQSKLHEYAWTKMKIKYDTMVVDLIMRKKATH